MYMISFSDGTTTATFRAAAPESRESSHEFGIAPLMPLERLHLCANRFEPWLPAEGVIAREVWNLPGLPK